MVSISEARVNIEIARSQVESQRQQIQQARLPTPTPTELRQRGRQQLIQREQQTRQLGIQKQKALQTLISVSQEIEEAEKRVNVVVSQLSEVRKRESDFKQAVKIFRSKQGDPFAPASIKAILRELERGRELQLKANIDKSIREIEAKGLKAIPFFEILPNGKGKLLGFRGIEEAIKKTKQSILDIIPIGKLDDLKKTEITFGQPEKFAESFRQATGSTSFTLAIPTRRENGKIRVQDFNFRFENGKLVRSQPTGTSLLTEKQFLERDKRRREKNPGFIFGSTIGFKFKPKEVIGLGKPFLKPSEIIIPKISKEIFEKFIDKARTIPILNKFIESQIKRQITSREIARLQIRGLEIAKQKTLTTLFPFFRKEKDLVNSENRKLQNNFKILNQSVTNFNNKFGDKELSETQFKLAENQKIILDKKIENFLNLQNQTEQNRTKRLDDRQRLFFEEAVKSAGVGVISLPFDIPKLIISGVVFPVKTTKEVTKGVKEFPTQLLREPATVVGGIAGIAVATGIFSGILKEITSIKTLKGSNQRFIFEIPSLKILKPSVKIPTKPFPFEVEFRINENRIINFARNQLNKKGINFNALSGIEKNFIVGQIKAKILNNPELFIPKSRQKALNRLGIKNKREAILQRLEAEQEAVVVFEKTTGRIRKQQPQLSEIQRLALQRLQETIQKQRIRRATVGRLERPLERPFDLLSDFQRNFFISQIKARIKADPSLTLTNTQRIALNKIKTKQELFDLRQAILSGLEPKRIGDLLTLFQRRFIKSQIEAQLRSDPAKFLPKARQEALKQFQKIQEKKAIKKAIEKGSENLKLSDLISKQDKDFIKGQIRAKIINQPEKFIPKSRQIALQLLKKPEPPKPVFQIVSGELSSGQKLLLQRLKQLGKPKPLKLVKKIKPKKKIVDGTIFVTGARPFELLAQQFPSRSFELPLEQLIFPGEKLGLQVNLFSKQFKVVNRQIGIELQRLKQNVKSKQILMNKFQEKLAQIQKQRFRQGTVLGLASAQSFQQQQAFRQSFLQAQRDFQSSRLQFDRFSQLIKQNVSLKQSELQRIKQRDIIRERVKPPKPPKPKRIILPKGIPKKKIKELPFKLKGKSFNVFTRQKGVFVKVASNLQKNRAKRFLARRLDNFISASGRIIPSKKPPKRKKDIGKFNFNERMFRFPKKNSKLIKRNTFTIIEKRRFRISSKQEKQSLALARVKASKLRRIKKSNFKRIK